MIKLLKFLTILALFLVSSESLGSYYYKFNKENERATFPLGYLLANHTVMIKLKTIKTDGTDFVKPANTKFRLQEAVDNTKYNVCTDDCNENPLDCVVICPIGISGSYELMIRSNSSRPFIQTFQIEASQYLTASGGPSNASAVI